MALGHQNRYSRMTIDTFQIHGFRGFSTPETLHLAQPTGQPGSGLTILVGPNSGGKSTLIEGFRVVAARQPQSFTEGRRNKKAGDRVSFRVTLTTGDTCELRTVDAGGSETHWVGGEQPNLPQILVLPSRRFFNPYFGRGLQQREQYARTELPPQRGQESSNFSARLFRALDNRVEFDEVLKNVLNPVPDWTIDQADGGQYYLKFASEGQFHNSDGMGEGIVSLFFIVDALYDSAEGEVIVIDEPELSLHPIFQERVSDLFKQYSATRQILYATHSPQFVAFDALTAGAKVARICKVDGASTINHLSEKTARALSRFEHNQNNPHIIGLDARKVFFLEDNVVLLEGQEDVIYLKRALSQIDTTIHGNFYGWGVGGADNMQTIAAMLQDLGFERVVGVLDNNVGAVLGRLRDLFPNYQFLEIPAQDVRTKPARSAREAIDGLLDDRGKLREECRPRLAELARQANAYLRPDGHVA